ncbi:MAG: type II toxin-antitoxin system Phd/YefM family antitoxin [Spirochaetota bacterium]
MTAINVTRFHEPLIVTRPNGQNVVVLSYEDYAAVEETSYLLRSPGIERGLVDMVAEG